MRLQHTLDKEGYRVAIARDGIEALDQIRASRPELIISDVVMPRMDGYELCRTIKADPEMQEIPVVLLTSLSEPTDVFRALESGADNFVSKPYEETFLLSNLRRMLVNLDLRKGHGAEFGIEVFFAGRKHFLNSSRIQIIDFLLSTYESALQKNEELNTSNRQLSDALETNKVLQANYRQLLETNIDAVVVIDRNGIVRYANPAADALFAAGPGQLRGCALGFDIAPGDRKEIEFVNGGGDEIIAEMRVVETNWDGEVVNLAVLRDITEHVRMRDELQRLSLRDELTGLHNRRGLTILAEQQIHNAARTGEATFLAFIDLDEFKPINDTYGHQEGDNALKDLANILTATFRKSDVVGRVGGDEFAVFGIVNDNFSPETLFRNLMDRIDRHNASGLRPYRLQLSTGLQHYPADAPDSLSAMLEKADALMYEEKRSKKSGRSVSR
jgi:two-component system cell cycle response regulator